MIFVSAMNVKKSYKIVMTTAFALSCLLIAIPLSILILNNYLLDLTVIIGFQSYILNLVSYFIVCGIALWAIFEFVIYLINIYFEYSSLFFRQQRTDVSYFIRSCFSIRNALLAAVYFIAFYFPVLFNWFVLFDFVINSLAVILFFFFARKKFGGDLIGYILADRIAKLYFIVMAFSIAIDIGGAIIL